MSVVEPETVAALCVCGNCKPVRIGEDVSERLDVTPAKFRVIVTRRPKYGCSHCKEGVAQAPAPNHLIDSGVPSEAVLAHVAVSKYADGLPLYRQEGIYARDGVEISRNSMANWMGHVGFHLTPLADRSGADQGGRAGLCGRDDAADIVAGLRQDEDSLAMDLRPGRSNLWRHGAAHGCLPVRERPRRRMRGATSRRLCRIAAG